MADDRRIFWTESIDRLSIFFWNNDMLLLPSQETKIIFFWIVESFSTFFSNTNQKSFTKKSLKNFKFSSDQAILEDNVMINMLIQ